MRTQTWSCRALFGAGLLLLSGSLAQAVVPSSQRSLNAMSRVGSCARSSARILVAASITLVTTSLRCSFTRIHQARVSTMSTG